MKKVHNFHPGDKVKMTSDCCPELNKGFCKGDEGVLTEAFDDTWELSVRINKNNHEWAVSVEDVELIEKSPVKTEVLVQIQIKDTELTVTALELGNVVKKLLALKKANKKTFTYKKNKIEFKNDELSTTIQVLVKLYNSFGWFYKIEEN